MSEALSSFNKRRNIKQVSQLAEGHVVKKGRSPSAFLLPLSKVLVISRDTIKRFVSLVNRYSLCLGLQGQEKMDRFWSSKIFAEASPSIHTEQQLR